MAASQPQAWRRTGRRTCCRPGCRPCSSDKPFPTFVPRTVKEPPIDVVTMAERRNPAMGQARKPKRLWQVRIAGLGRRRRRPRCPPLRFRARLPHMEHHEVIVIGAGVAGLYQIKRLVDLGIDATVLEAGVD